MRSLPKIALFTGALLASVVGLYFFDNSTASAISNPYPDMAAETHASNGALVGNSPMYLSVGTGEFNGWQNATKVYSPSQVYSVIILHGNICGNTWNDGSYATQSVDIVSLNFTTTFYFNNRSNATITTATGGVNCGSLHIGATIDLGAGSYNSETGMYEGYIVAAISSVGGVNTNSFRYQFNGGTYGGLGNPGGAGVLAMSNRNVPTGYYHNVNVGFAATCASPASGAATLRFFDVDHGVYQGVGNYPNLTYSLYGRPRTGGAYSNILPPGGGEYQVSSGNGVWSAFGNFNYSRDWEYVLAVRGLSRPNALIVEIAAPGATFEDFPAGSNCGNVTCAVDWPSTVYRGGTATYRRSGGSATGTVSWSIAGGGASPSSGTGNSITVTFSTTGTKTATISQGGATAQCSAVVIDPPPPTCSASPATALTGDSITFTKSGGTASGTVSWSFPGANITSGTGNVLARTYATRGVKTATVTQNGISRTCTVTISARPTGTVTASCTANATLGYGRVVVTINASDADGTNMNYIARIVSNSVPPGVEQGASNATGSRQFTFNNQPADGATRTAWGWVRDSQTGSWILLGTPTYVCPTYNSATCVSATITDNAGTYPNNTFRVNVTFRNNGTRTWVFTGGNPHNMGARSPSTGMSPATPNFITDDNSPTDFGVPSAARPATSVGPGGNATFSFTYDTPDTTNGSTYNYYWRMYQHGIEWFGATCGLRFTLFSGEVGDAFQWSNKRQIDIATFSGTVRTNSNGIYNAAVARDSTSRNASNAVISIDNRFSATASPAPAMGVDDVWVRAGGEAYRNCSANTYCYQPAGTSRSNYVCQRVGVNTGAENCSSETVDWDRANDTGYNFALGWRPDVSCEIDPITVPAGLPYTPQIRVNNPNIANGTTVAIATAANGITHTVLGQVSTGTLSPALAEGSSRDVDLSPDAIIPTSTTFVPTGSVTWSGAASPANPYSGTTACATSGDIPGEPPSRSVYWPYFKTYNADVRVGGSFNSGDNACAANPPTSGRVTAFADNRIWPGGTVAEYRGASSQFALIARNSVIGGGVAAGFYSGAANTGMSPTYKALTFANTAATGTYGGSFGATHCMTDYYQVTREPEPAVVTGGTYNRSDLLAARNTATNQVQVNGNLVLAGGAAAFGAGTKLTIYVDGDVWIRQNLVSQSGYADEDSIPFFALVVRGNIMIDPSVTQLDGIYVAQPTSGGGKGGIYTCATSLSTLCATSTLYSAGANKLTFNGFVVAKIIKLLRTNGHIVNGTPTEGPDSANIAEVFNADPSVFIAEPAFRQNTTEAGLYDSATSLPPLL